MIMYDHVRPSSKIFKDLQRSSKFKAKPANWTSKRSARHVSGTKETAGLAHDLVHVDCSETTEHPLSIRSRRERRKSSEKGAAFEVFEVEAVARCSVTDFLIFLEV